MASKQLNIKRIVIIAAVVFAAIALIATIYFVIEAPKTANIDVVVAPVSATVKIGEKNYGNGKHRIEPGTYDVQITKEGFSSYKGQIIVEAGNTEKVYVCLEKDENNTDYYESHKEDADACWQVEEYNFEKLEGEKYSDPIFSVAPYHSYSRGFYIDPYFDSEEKVHIKITLVTCIVGRADGLKKNAIEWLSQKGIDVEKYPIEYSSCAYGD